MKRSQILLTALGAVLVVALFYVLLFQPARDDLADLESQIASERQTQAELQSEINRLRAVREEAPEVEAELAAAESIVPRDAALPAALRQLQSAADESGITLESVTTSRPQTIEEAPDGLSSITVSTNLLGGYFQLVDFLRRIEDPSISPRGVTWEDVTVSREDAYPDLQVTVTGSLYALIAVPPPPETESSDPEVDDGVDAGDDGDADVDVETDADVDPEDGAEDVS